MLDHHEVFALSNAAGFPDVAALDAAVLEAAGAVEVGLMGGGLLEGGERGMGVVGGVGEREGERGKEGEEK